MRCAKRDSMRLRCRWIRRTSAVRSGFMKTWATRCSGNTRRFDGRWIEVSRLPRVGSAAICAFGRLRKIFASDDDDVRRPGASGGANGIAGVKIGVVIFASRLRQLGLGALKLVEPV